MRKWLALSLLLLLSVFAFRPASAQDNASMTGEVTDASGAVVPNTIVVLTNSARGLTFTVKTNNEGSYRFPNVPPAPGYKVSFSHEGFSNVNIDSFALVVGITRTQDAKLPTGSSQATVEVSAQQNVVTLNTTDASIGNNIDVELVDELPVQNRQNPAALFILQPGVTNQGSVTGSRTDQTSVTVDGMDVNDVSTGQFGNTNGAIPVDALQEFRGTVAGLPANLGTGSGAQFQLVTKSGTNRFHGSVSEYHRDTSTASNFWFNNNSTVPVARPALIRNQFGGLFSGPVLHDRAFFLVDFYNSRIVQALTGNDTVPLNSFRAGNVSYVKTGCSATTSRQNTTPQCIGAYTPAQIRALDPAGIGESATVFSLINSRYPQANDLTGGDGVNTGSFRFTQPTLSVLYAGVGRIDYNITSKQRVFLQFHEAHQDSVQSINRFPGDPLTRPFQDRSYGYVASHIWQIGSNKVNQFYYGSNTTIFSFPLAYNPNGATIVANFLPFTAPYDGGNIQRRRVPIPEVRDDFNWTRGNHNLTFGGSFKFIKTSNFLGSDYNSYTIGLGGNVATLNPSLRPSDLQATGTTNISQWDNAFPLALGRVARITSIYNFTADGTQSPSGSGANRRFRYYQTEAYLGDTWKVNKELTLTYGLRYQLYSVPFETLGAESVPNTGFDDYFAARVKQSQAGISGATSVPLITYNLGGKVNNAPGYYEPNLKDFAPRFAFAYNPDALPKTVFNGSAALIYDRTVANAVNFLQNQSTFLFQNSVARSYGSSASPANSLATDPRVGATITDLPAAPTTAAPGRPYAPFVSAAGVPTGLITQNTTFAIDNHLKDPYNITYNFGVQQEFPGKFILKANYVGRLGRRLLGQADSSQLIDYNDPGSGQALSQAFANVTTQLRNGTAANAVTVQPWFERVLTPGFYANQNCGTTRCTSNTQYVANNQNQTMTLGDITDALQAFASAGILPTNVGLASQFAVGRWYTNKGFSSYNGLLATLSKNLSNGVKFDLNYTWGHSIDNVSIIANAVSGGAVTSGFVCDVLRPRVCRGTSDFDVAHIVSSDFVAKLPFGRGRTFGRNVPWYIDELIGGWDFSGIPIWQSGYAVPVVSNAFIGSFANNVSAIYDGSRSDDIATHVHKDSANRLVGFKDVNKALSHFRGPVGIEYGSRNPLRGPSQFYFDAGLAKTFPLLPENRLALKFRADAFNVLNHPTFAPQGSNITTATFGVISAPTSPLGGQAYRVGQFSLRLEF